MLLKIQDLWDGMPCKWLNSNPHVKGLSCLHLQSQAADFMTLKKKVLQAFRILTTIYPSPQYNTPEDFELLTMTR
jgi:hypothetical protein